MDKKTLSKLVRAVKNTIVLGASTHLAILLFAAIMSNDYTIMNLFNILDLEFFYPELSEGPFMFVMSYVLIGSVVAYFFFREED